MFAMITITGAEGIMSYGLTRLLMGVTFSLGLLLVSPAHSCSPATA